MSIRRTLLVGSVLLSSVGWVLPPGSKDENGERGPLAFRVTLTDSALKEMEGLRTLETLVLGPGDDLVL